MIPERADRPPSFRSAAGGRADGEASLLDVVNLILRRRLLLAYGGIGGAALFVLVSFLSPRTYEARTAFIQAETGVRTTLPAGLGALASSFGVSATVGGATTTLDFLKSALRSRDVLDSVILHPLALDSSPFFTGVSARVDSVNLITWLRIHDKTPAFRLDHARRMLLGRLRVTTEPRSGIVHVALRLRDPYLAAAVLRRLVAVLNDFNLYTRRTTSRANRMFLEGRLVTVKAQLDSAEDRLRHFYEQNRRIADAPALVFEESRLKRQADMIQTRYVALAQDLEQARTVEIKDTPPLTVVETAQPPVRPVHRRLALAFMGGFVGLALALIAAAADHYFRRAARVRSPAWYELEEHLAALPGGGFVARRLGKPSAEPPP